MRLHVALTFVGGLLLTGERSGAAERALDRRVDPTSPIRYVLEHNKRQVLQFASVCEQSLLRNICKDPRGEGADPAGCREVHALFGAKAVARSRAALTHHGDDRALALGGLLFTIMLDVVEQTHDRVREAANSPDTPRARNFDPATIATEVMPARKRVVERLGLEQASRDPGDFLERLAAQHEEICSALSVKLSEMVQGNVINPAEVQVAPQAVIERAARMGIGRELDLWGRTEARQPGQGSAHPLVSGWTPAELVSGRESVLAELASQLNTAKAVGSVGTPPTFTLAAVRAELNAGIRGYLKWKVQRERKHRLAAGEPSVLGENAAGKVSEREVESLVAQLVAIERTMAFEGRSFDDRDVTLVGDPDHREPSGEIKLIVWADETLKELANRVPERRLVAQALERAQAMLKESAERDDFGPVDHLLGTRAYQLLLTQSREAKAQEADL